MRTLTTIIIVTAICIASPASGHTEAYKVPGQAMVEVAFVLDTTGSMGGLIAGAKAKIWAIANQIVLGQPKPIVRMALVAYQRYQQ